MKQISFHQVSIQDGFWKEKETLNRKVTIFSVWDQFVKTGRIAAFQYNWKEGMEHKPHIYWDSDVAKWMEGASDLIAKQPDPVLSERIEFLIDCIEKHQDKSGYFNIYYTVCEPNKRFTDRNCHELYCAGHLIEAAVAYYEATGKDRFLKLMMKYADYIKQVFMEEQSASFITPGHEEIELALVRLYRCTKEKRFFELALFFVDRRGEQPEGMGHAPWTEQYVQSHIPVRQQKTATGHAVRACYLYCAMADLAYETGDQELKDACKAIFDDIASKKMYLTGGIGSTHVGEAFTLPYDLPNQTAYAETCAAIGLMLFAHRMSSLEPDGKYQDVLERAMYNGMLSGISLDGTRFFYENPLELNLNNYKRYQYGAPADHFPLTRRPDLFNCSCCPPNLNRILASMGNFCYGLEGNSTVYVHQFMDSTLEQGGIRLTQKTAYPKDGSILINATGAECLKIRIPCWCNSFSMNQSYTMERGYAVITDLSSPVHITFGMTPTLIMATPRVWENANRVAVQRGPVVYCTESVDNMENLHNLYLDKNATFEEHENQSFILPVLTTDGWQRKDSDQLYTPLEEQFVPKTLTLIPYHCFANRQESNLLVWMNYK